MKLATILYCASVGFLTIQCQSQAKESNPNFVDSTRVDSPSQRAAEPEYIDTLFDRSTIKAALVHKMALKQPLVVHAYIPLCDNIHQGIVPTTATLGDGMNLKSNLYWATSGGTKAYFKKQSDWSLVFDVFDLDTNVLERVVFKKIYPQTTVYLVADAYRGDRMEETVNDFMASISGNRYQTIQLNDSSNVLAAAHADLFIFNGHNGLMDNITVKRWINTTEKRTDIVMNSCLSYGYLQNELMYAGGYPLVRSNSTLYPGAYVLEQIIDDWVAGKDEKEICLRAGATYCQKHDCGAGTKVYKSGW